MEASLVGYEVVVFYHVASRCQLSCRASARAPKVLDRLLALGRMRVGSANQRGVAAIVDGARATSGPNPQSAGAGTDDD